MTRPYLRKTSICLQFVGGNDFPSKLIEWFSAGHYSHVDVVLPTGDLLGAREDKVGGKDPGVQIRPPNYESFHVKTDMTLSCTAKEARDFYRYLNDQVGKPYDKPAILGFVFGRDWRQEDSWFCSELVARALEVSLIMPMLLLPPNKVTPTALADLCKAIGGRIL